VGAAGLALARRVPGIRLALVEIDPELASLARANADANAIVAEAIALDVTADADVFAANGLAPDSVDVVLMNPPFNDPARHRGSPDQARQAAHVATEDTLRAWVHAARRILKSGGVLTLIWRADGLAEVLAALSRGFGSLSVLPVHGEAGRPAIRVLVRAVKGGRALTRLYPGLMLNEESTVPKKEVQKQLQEKLQEKLNAILTGRAVLPLAEA
jgi:tRNA1(Val) A37 N6-methylase TrmN6